MALSRHAQCADECPLLGAKRTLTNRCALVNFGGRSLSALFGPFQAGANTITKLLDHCRPPLRLPYRSALSSADPAASAVPRRMRTWCGA